MTWKEDVLDTAKFALRWLIFVNHRMIAQNPRELAEVASLTRDIREWEVVKEIYSLMTEFNYSRRNEGGTVLIQREVPVGANVGSNDKRVDLMIKPYGAGKRKQFIEVKSFSSWNTSRNNELKKDTQKLMSLSARNGKYSLIYRGYAVDSREKPIEDLPTIKKAVRDGNLVFLDGRSIEDVTIGSSPGRVQIHLYQVKGAM